MIVEIKFAFAFMSICLNCCLFLPHGL